MNVKAGSIVMLNTVLAENPVYMSISLTDSKSGPVGISAWEVASNERLKVFVAVSLIDFTPRGRISGSIVKYEFEQVAFWMVTGWRSIVPLPIL